MTESDLRAIEQRWIAHDYELDEETGKEKPVQRVINHDVAVLLAEVRRLRGEVARLRAEKNGREQQ